MPKFQIKSNEQANMVELEQAGDDVIVRVNGYGLIVLRSNPYAVECSEAVAKELGIAIVTGA